MFDSKEETDDWVISQYPARQMNHPGTDWIERMKTEQSSNDRIPRLVIMNSWATEGSD